MVSNRIFIYLTALIWWLVILTPATGADVVDVLPSHKAYQTATAKNGQSPSKKKTRKKGWFAKFHQKFVTKHLARQFPKLAEQLIDCDTLVLHDGTKIAVKMITFNVATVLYQPCGSTTDAPNQTILKEKIARINYADGRTGTIRIVPFEEEENKKEGSAQVAGFFLGFFLGLIGVLIAFLLFNRRSRKKAVLAALVGTVAIVLLLLFLRSNGR